MLSVSTGQARRQGAPLDGAARVTRLERAGARQAELQATLREVVQRLAGIDRTPCSAGERDAARWPGSTSARPFLRRVKERAPALIERVRTSPPRWWIGLAAPLLGAATAVTRRRRFAGAGLLIGAFGTAAVADIWRSRTVAGA